MGSAERCRHIIFTMGAFNIKIAHSMLQSSRLVDAIPKLTRAVVVGHGRNAARAYVKHYRRLFVLIINFLLTATLKSLMLTVGKILVHNQESDPALHFIDFAKLWHIKK